MQIVQAVGKNCSNSPADVRTVHRRLMEIAKIPCYPCSGHLDDTLMAGILELQAHFMMRPDGVISVGGKTHAVLRDWTVKPVGNGVQLPGRLRQAWDLVNPLLPEGSYCSSGFRSADDQRRILHRFFNQSYRAQIIGKYGQKAYDSAKADLLASEDKVLEMVRGVGQAISAPGKSLHQQGKAIDIGGPSYIDNKQVEVVRLVARANPTLLSGRVLKERNGCVHFELR